MTKQKTLLLLSLILVAYLVGRFSGHDAKPGATAAAETTAVTEYTCSMHPQIRQPGPGLCPICAMELIPVSEDQKPSGPRSLSLTDAARALARIETAPVTRGAATVVISLTGSLRYPTERAREIALNTEVQIRNVLTPLDGTRVSAGQALAELYSPDVFSAMRELANAGPNGTLVNAARQKLHLIG